MYFFELFLTFFLAFFGVNAAPTSETDVATEHSLVARDDFVGNQCAPSELTWGDCGAINEGLRFLDGRGSVHILARSKQRVSCSYNTGIYYENNEVSKGRSPSSVTKLILQHHDVDVSGKVIADQVRHFASLCDSACVPGQQTFSGIGIYSAHRIFVTGTSAFGQKC
jgi:hypothetical protein